MDNKVTGLEGFLAFKAHSKMREQGKVLGMSQKEESRGLPYLRFGQQGHLFGWRQQTSREAVQRPDDAFVRSVWHKAIYEMS